MLTEILNIEKKGSNH